MCKVIDDKVVRCFVMACPLDQAIVRSMQLDGANYAVEMLEAKIAELTSELETMSGTVAKLGESLETAGKDLARIQGNADRLARQVESAREWLIEQKDEMSGEEFIAVYEELANILDVNLEEEVTVEVVMTQTLVVKVPLGHELNENDFWANGRSNGMLDCNYTIESEEGDIEIEDIRVNTRY